MKIEELRQASEDDPGLIQRLADEQGVTCAEYMDQHWKEMRPPDPVIRGVDALSELVAIAKRRGQLA